MTSLLFEPLTLRGTTVPNRVWLAPMCQYSAAGDGVPTDWHLVHLGARASGGFGLVTAEATAVLPEGRISPRDVGLWSDDQIPAWHRVTAAIHAAGSVAGVQLAHAGRKASVYWPWAERSGTVPADDGGWATAAPSAVAFPGYAAPTELSVADIAAVTTAFGAAAARAVAAGFDVVEVHAAHGYLLHEFLSPLSNQRTDGYGGPLDHRARALLETVAAVRAAVPDSTVVMVRFSGTDALPGGLEVEEVATVTGWLADQVDLVDLSSGGLLPAPIAAGPGYQVPLAAAVRRATTVPVSAVGLITSAAQAEQVLVDGAADAVRIGRAALREAAWPLRAAHELGVPTAEAGWPAQYLRGTWH